MASRPAAAQKDAGHTATQSAQLKSKALMKKLKIFIAESVDPADFYAGNGERHVVRALAEVLHWKASYKIALDSDTLRQAIAHAANSRYDIFHLSCHGDKVGIQLSNPTELSWDELADCFQDAQHTPRALVVSSCVGGDAGVARAFSTRKRRPAVIFGAEGTKARRIIFPGACISWPILCTALARAGVTREAFKDAVAKMNLITKHQFVYRRWQEGEYRRCPSLKRA